MLQPSRRHPVVVVLGFVALGLGCETQPTHEVLSLHDVSPRQLETGDRVIVHGAGLPAPQDIRRIELRVVGDLARPGARPCARPVALTLHDPPLDARYVDPATGETRVPTYADSAVHAVRVEGGARLEFVLSPAMMQTLSRCAEEGDAEPAPAHASLALQGARAGLSVRIETTQGAVLSAARALRGPVLELLPSGAALSTELRARAEADRALETLGMRLAAAHPAEGGLQVERVTPGSAADEAGVLDGDVLVRLDGVTLLGPIDFRPAAGREVSQLLLRRGDALDEHALRVATLRPTAPADLVATGVLLLVALAALWLSRGLPPSLRWLGALGGRPPADAGFHHRALDLAPLRGQPLGQVWRNLRAQMTLPVQLAATAAVASLAAAVPLGPLGVGLNPDLARLHGLTTLGALALAFGLARHTRSAWRDALVALARRALDESFGLLGLVAAVALAGSLHAHDLADAQGGAPWRWIALQGPWTAFLALSVVAAAVRATEPGVALDLRAHAAALAWVFARGLIFAVVFLGAWRVPGWSAAAQEASPGASMLGALLLVAKAWAFVAVVYALRARAAHVTAARWSRMALRTVLPTAVLCLGVTTTLALGGQSLGATVQDVVSRTASGATLALALLGAATLLVRRLRPARTLGYVPQP